MKEPKEKQKEKALEQLSHNLGRMLRILTPKEREKYGELLEEAIKDLEVVKK